MARHASEYFTLPGRALVLLSILLAAGGTVGYIAWAWEGLPPGSYPLWFFALPALLAAGLFFALGTGILRWFGVKVFQDPDKP
jgi:hypothetical protein